MIQLVATQIKSINYQLSNLKYLQEGWTVRPSSRIDFDDSYENESDLLANEDSTQTYRATELEYDTRFNERPLIIKKYKDGTDCLTLFPDGSGNVFYPSGRLALSIIIVSHGMHIITAFSDDYSKPTQIAQFDPYGN